MRRSRPRIPMRPLLSVLLVLLCAAAVVMLARVAVGTASGQRLDQLTLSGAQADHSPMARAADALAGTVSVPVVIGLLVCVVVIALARRRPGLLLPIGVLVGGTNLTTQVVKHLVVSREVMGPGIEVTPNSFPSGHTTVAASIAVALVLVCGRARGPVALLGVLWTAGAGLGTITLGWHRASDVGGAILLVAAWAFLILAVDGFLQHHRAAELCTWQAPGPGERFLVALLAAVGLIATALGAVAFTAVELPLLMDDPAHQQAAYRTTVAVISGGAALWMALTLALRAPEVRRSMGGERVR